MFKNYVRHNVVLRPACVFLTLVAFVLSVVFPPAVAAQALSPNIPQPGLAVPSASALMWGMRFFPDNPFKFDFIIQKGSDPVQSAEFRKESEDIIKYFLTALTIPEDQLWVNLSPYENNRIVPIDLGQTQMGQDLLLQDYFLKQLTASLTNPDTDLGKKFWDRVYQKAFEEFGTTNIPVNTFNKIWIVPSKANVYVSGGSVFITKSELKVMLEKDYLAFQKNIGSSETDSKSSIPEKANDISSKIVRNILVPEIENEVNHGKVFAQLRQIYHSLILASWFKKNLRQAILNQVYSDQKKIAGVKLEDPGLITKIYDSYVDAFKKGVCEKIKVVYDPQEKKFVPRQYFSGGSDLNLSKVLTEDPSFGTKGMLHSLATAGDLVNETSEIISSKQKSNSSPLRSSKSFKTFFATMVLSVVLSLSTPYLNFASGDIARLDNDPRLKTELSTQTSVSDQIVSRPGIIGAEDQTLLQQFVSLEDIASLDGQVNPITHQTYQIDRKFFEKNLSNVLQSNVFGWGYETVVIAAQRKLGLPEDGDFGPQTRKALMKTLQASQEVKSNASVEIGTSVAQDTTVNQKVLGQQDTIAAGFQLDMDSSKTISASVDSSGIGSPPPPPPQDSIPAVDSTRTDTVVVIPLVNEVQQQILQDTAGQSQIAMDLVSAIISAPDTALIDTAALEKIENPDISEAIQETAQVASQAPIADVVFAEQIQPRLESISDSIEFQDYLVRDMTHRIALAKTLEELDLIIIPSTIPAELRASLERLRNIRQAYLKSLFDRSTLPVNVNPLEQDLITAQDVIADTVALSRQIATASDSIHPMKRLEPTLSESKTSDFPIVKKVPEVRIRSTIEPMERLSPKVIQLYQLALDTTLRIHQRQSYPVDLLPSIEADTVVQVINDYQQALAKTVADTLSQDVRSLELIDTIQKIQEDTLSAVLSNYPAVQDTLSRIEASNDSVPKKVKSNFLRKMFDFRGAETMGQFDFETSTNTISLGGRIKPYGKKFPLYFGGEIFTQEDTWHGFNNWVDKNDTVFRITRSSFSKEVGIEFEKIRFLDNATLDLGYHGAKTFSIGGEYSHEFDLANDKILTLGADGTMYVFANERMIPVNLSLSTELKIRDFMISGDADFFVVRKSTLFGCRIGATYKNIYAEYVHPIGLATLDVEDQDALGRIAYHEAQYQNIVRAGMNFSDKFQGGIYYGFGNDAWDKQFGFEIRAFIGNHSDRFQRSDSYPFLSKDSRLLRVVQSFDTDFDFNPEYITGASSGEKTNLLRLPFSGNVRIWDGISVGVRGQKSINMLTGGYTAEENTSFNIVPTLAYDFSGLIKKFNPKLGDRLEAEIEVAGKALGLKGGYDLLNVANKKETFHFKTDVDGQLWLVSLDETKGFVPILSLGQEFDIKSSKFVFSEDILIHDGLAWYGKVSYENHGWRIFVDFPIFGGQVVQKDFMDHIDHFDAFKWQAGLTIPLKNTSLDVSFVKQGKDKDGILLPGSITGLRFKLNLPISKPKKSSSVMSAAGVTTRIENLSRFANQVVDLNSRPDGKKDSYGGINLSDNVMSITSEGDAASDLRLPSGLNIEEWKNIQGFIPVIINIVPIANFNLFLSGLSEGMPLS